MFPQQLPKISKELTQKLFLKLLSNPLFYLVCVIELQKSYVQSRLAFLREAYIILTKVLPQDAAMIQYDMHFRPWKRINFDYSLKFSDLDIKNFITQLQAGDERLITSLIDHEQRTGPFAKTEYNMGIALLGYYSTLEYYNYYLTILSYILQFCFWPSLFL